MENSLLKQTIEGLHPEITFTENKQFTEVVVPAGTWHAFCAQLKTHPDLHFDYMISLTAVDWKDYFMLVCHLNSTVYRHVMVVKARIDDHENPIADTLSDIWRTSEFHEREVYDLFGIRFTNHPNMRRLFLEDDYGFPLRKDFTDETRMIVK
jgi:NADH-quinone oxidoreductase subunit C